MSTALMARHPRRLRAPAGLAAMALLACSGGGPTDTPTETPGATGTPTSTEAATPTASPTETATATGTPTVTLPEVCRGDGCPPAVRINELVADNEGAWVDEEGETDDLLELYNASGDPVSLAGWTMGDDRDDRHPVPAVTLEPGEALLLWADDDEEQGANHLSFKLSADGETVYLWDADEQLVDVVTFPALEPNDAWARFPDGTGEFQVCAFASPGQPNGDTCGPPARPDLPEDVSFTPYVWPDPWPAPPAPLALNELVLRPASFVEILNTSSQEVDLSGFDLRLATHVPGEGWPGSEAGVSVPLPAVSLAAGARIDVTVEAAHTAALEATDSFEGVISLFDVEGAAVDRLDFMSWPSGAALARQPDGQGVFTFCAETTPARANTRCDPLPSRPVGSYLRHIFTPGDYAALAYGDPKVGVESVKSVQDLEGGDITYLLSSAAWDLHYTFVREVIEGLPHLDRCDPSEASQFNAGWYAFSVTNYYTVEGRRYLLGTLGRYGTNDLRTVEFSTGDVLVADQMRYGLFTVAARMAEPIAWSLRAQDDRQTAEILSIDGTVPAVGPSAPFDGMTYQPLNEGVTFGTLTFIPAEALEDAVLGSQVVVVTDTVPLDIDIVGGLITESFQTPLAHVAILSRNRDTPNMALPGARDDARVAPLLGQLVRLEVSSGDFELRQATPEEALAFWESRGRPDPQVPALDAGPRGMVDLAEASWGDVASVGAKAALMAELLALAEQRGPTAPVLRTPDRPFAVPVSYYLDHFEASGARAQLDLLLEDPDFLTDPAHRRQALLNLQEMILDHPVDAALVSQIESFAGARFGHQRLRFRSSSNTEDLQGFSGAGLYTSTSAAVGDDDLPVDDALRVVWASLWNPRAYEERAYFNVDQGSVAMGVLVHPAFLGEEANGVGISRNILDPRRGSTYYLNVQRGEASVTNPAPGVSADELLYRFNIVPPEQWLARSSFLGGEPVLTSAERTEVATLLKVIHDDLRALLDPLHEEAFFAVDIEFKYVEAEEGGRQLVVKQARPYNFGSSAVDPCAK